MDNVQKVNYYTNEPSSQTLRPYKHGDFKHVIHVNPAASYLISCYDAPRVATKLGVSSTVSFNGSQ
jgi:hypothetical protein